MLHLPCFYSTYEELKRLFCTSICKILFLFLQYLWGIETLKVSLSHPVEVPFLQYLWGIETKPPIMVIHTVR